MRALILFLSLVLALSAAHKLYAPGRMTTATGRLAGVTGPAAMVLMVLAGAIEAVAALCLVLPGALTVGALLASGVWLAYAVALWRRRGTVLDCGCDPVARPRAVDTAQIARPLLLSTLALAVCNCPFPVSSESFAVDVLAAFGALALYVAALEIMAIPNPRWRSS